MAIEKRLFPAGIKLEAADLEAISENARAAIAEMVAAFASSGTSGENVLFFDSDLGLGDTSGLQLDVPAQYFAVKGIIGYYPGGSIIVNTSDTFHIYFELTEVLTSEVRPTLIGGVASSDTVDVASSYLVSLEFSTDPTEPDPNDLQLRVATVVSNATDITSVSFDPDSFLISFSGTISSNHSDSHLPGGADELPFATSTNDISGLMPPSYVKVTEAAITDITVSGALTRTLASARDLSATPSENAALVERTADITLAVDTRSFNQANDSLEAKFNDSAIPGNIASPGTSYEFARADHKHVNQGDKFNAQILFYVNGVQSAANAQVPGGTLLTFDLLKGQSDPAFLTSYDPARVSSALFYKEQTIDLSTEIEAIDAYYIPPIAGTQFTTQILAGISGRDATRARCRRFPMQHTADLSVVAKISTFVAPQWFDYHSGVRLSFNDLQQLTLLVRPSLITIGAIEHSIITADYVANTGSYVEAPYFIESGYSNVPSGYLPSSIAGPSVTSLSLPSDFVRPINGWVLLKLVLNKNRPST